MSDNGELVGTESYMEEEFWLDEATNFVPEIDIHMELLNIGNKDIIIVNVPEAEKKPIYLKGKKRRKVFVRQADESVLANEELIEVMKLGSQEEGITFEFGENEQLLFRFLNEYSEITVERFSTIINTTTYTLTKYW